MLEGRLRRLRRDRPRADQGRRAPARRVRGLRGPGRRRRHARDRRPGSPPRPPCRWSSTRPSPTVIEAGPGADSAAARSSTRSTTRTATGPDSRIARVMPLVREHGAAVIALTIDERGQARTAEWKVAVAEPADRGPDRQLGHAHVEDIIVDCLTFPIATGQEETRRDGIETIEAIAELKRRYPDVQTTLGVSNVSFGLNPAARAVLNSVFLAECVRAGLDSAIVHASRIMPIARIPEEQLQIALDLVYDRRREGYDPLARLLELFEGVDAAASRPAGPPNWPGCRCGSGSSGGSSTASGPGSRPTSTRRSAQRPALEIVNDVLLDGMKTVGELFGSGQMQLPFVLQSAEVMKAAVGYLEPHMERSRRGRQGPHRARHGQGRRARHRQEPGRHHLVQQRLRRRQHRHQAAASRRSWTRRPRQRRRRHRHVRAAGQVDRGDARQPGRAELPAAWPPGGRCCSAAPRSPAPTWSRTWPRCSTARCATPGTPSRACG